MKPIERATTRLLGDRVSSLHEEHECIVAEIGYRRQATIDLYTLMLERQMNRDCGRNVDKDNNDNVDECDRPDKNKNREDDDGAWLFRHHPQWLVEDTAYIASGRECAAALGVATRAVADAFPKVPGTNFEDVDARRRAFDGAFCERAPKYVFELARKLDSFRSLVTFIEARRDCTLVVYDDAAEAYQQLFAPNEDKCFVDVFEAVDFYDRLHSATLTLALPSRSHREDHVVGECSLPRSVSMELTSYDIECERRRQNTSRIKNAASRASGPEWKNAYRNGLRGCYDDEDCFFVEKASTFLKTWLGASLHQTRSRPSHPEISLAMCSLSFDVRLRAIRERRDQLFPKEKIRKSYEKNKDNWAPEPPMPIEHDFEFPFTSSPCAWFAPVLPEPSRKLMEEYVEAGEATFDFLPRIASFADLGHCSPPTFSTDTCFPRASFQTPSPAYSADYSVTNPAYCAYSPSWSDDDAPRKMSDDTPQKIMCRLFPPPVFSPASSPTHVLDVLDSGRKAASELNATAVRMKVSHGSETGRQEMEPEHDFRPIKKTKQQP